MPSNSPHSDPENFSFDEFSGQGFLKFDSDEFTSAREFQPEWTAHVFPNVEERKTKGSNLLATLKRADSPKGKRELAYALYPQAFDPRIIDQYQTIWDGYRFVRCAALIEKKYLDRTGAIIRSIYKDIRNNLSKLDGENQKLSYLRTVSLPIAIGEGDNKEALYIYHGTDFPASMEDLQSYVEWAIVHQAKQSQLLEVALKLQTANHNRNAAQINIDIPDDLTELETGGLQESI
jgi:hypothetical protein